jgi:hypothetical protein
MPTILWMKTMNKRTISSINLHRIPARQRVLSKAVATVITTGKMAAVPRLAKPYAPSAGNSPVLPFYPRHMSKNKTLIKGG